MSRVSPEAVSQIEAEAGSSRPGTGHRSVVTLLSIRSNGSFVRSGSRGEEPLDQAGPSATTLVQVHNEDKADAASEGTGADGLSSPSQVIRNVALLERSAVDYGVNVVTTPSPPPAPTPPVAFLAGGQGGGRLTHFPSTRINRSSVVQVNGHGSANSPDADAINNNNNKNVHVDPYEDETKEENTSDQPIFVSEKR